MLRAKYCASMAACGSTTNPTSSRAGANRIAAMAQLSSPSAMPPVPPGETASQVAAFLAGFSLEAIRPNARGVEGLNRPPADAIKPPGAPRAAACDPVPHLVARNFTSREAFGDLLARLRNEAAIHRVLIIAGDRDDAAGPLESAIDAVESGLLQRHGIDEVGIAGYSDGHPRISTDMLDRALAAKIEAAEQSGLKVHIVTQFAFDAAIIIAWVRRMRDL